MVRLDMYASVHAHTYHACRRFVADLSALCACVYVLMCMYVCTYSECCRFVADLNLTVLQVVASYVYDYCM